MIDCLKGERDAAYAKRLAAAKSASDPQHVVITIAVYALIVRIDTGVHRLLVTIEHDLLYAIPKRPPL